MTDYSKLAGRYARSDGPDPIQASGLVGLSEGSDLLDAQECLPQGLAHVLQR